MKPGMLAWKEDYFAEKDQREEQGLWRQLWRTKNNWEEELWRTRTKTTITMTEELMTTNNELLNYFQQIRENQYKNLE